MAGAPRTKENKPCPGPALHDNQARFLFRSWWNWMEGIHANSRDQQRHGDNWHPLRQNLLRQLRTKQPHTKLN